MKQETLFDTDEFTKWHDEWQNMPEFVQEDLAPERQLIVSFATKEDVAKFSELIGQSITKDTKSLWFPRNDREKPSNFIYA